MDPLQIAEADEALDKTKISLMSRGDSAFFTRLCFSMKHKWSEDLPTAACDGKTIYWNPDFFLGLANAEERIFIMLHETMHAAYLHMDPVRMNGRCPDRWNVAADHVINLQLIDRGFTMPTGVNKGVADPIYRNLCTEDVYKQLPENPGKPVMVDLLAPSGDTEELRKEVQDNLIQASIQSRVAGDKAGTIPGEIEIFLRELLTPELPWTRLLQKYLQVFAKNDYSFKRPNRRFFPKYYLPSMLNESLIDLCIAVDTSGSVSDSDFLRFISEIHGVFKMMKPKKITLIQFDAKIRDTAVVSSMKDLMNVKFKGRGGTVIRPVLEWAKENKPQLLLVFTDGEFSFPKGKLEVELKNEFLWLIHDNENFKAPMGKTIHYNL
jgi:predicted metal-dependent peptidase